MNASAAEQSLRAGDTGAALRLLQQDVREHPSDAKLRIFLFQLLALLGQWDRALAQLEVAAGLEPSALAMAQMYREAIRCELIRKRVFRGDSVPMVFGQPDAWLAMLIEAMLTEARGDAELASRLRADALTQSPASAGTIDGKPFAWIADADSRLGPVLEVIINGRYYWLPFENLSEVTIEAPADLRDLVWMPAHFTLANGGESVGLIPTRYPGSEEADDAQLALARKTVWKQMDAENYHGLGQRLLTTDADDMPLMDIRSIVMSPAPVDAGAGGG